MPRIACLFVPDFPLAALYRTEPNLRGRPLAVADGHHGCSDGRALLLAISPEAAAQGIRLGLSVAQARALSASLLVRRVTVECLRAAEDALADLADSFSPRVESRGGGLVFLDVDGLASLFGSEAHLATLLAARSQRIGLDARVGIASGKTAALFAARQSNGVEILPPGRERERLSALPIRFLDPAPDLALTFERWGIRTLGDLARLPCEAVGSRLGKAGLALWRRAHGADEEPLVPCPPARRLEEVVDCEYAIDSFEPLSFLLRGALERLTARLDVRGLRSGDLEISLRLEGNGREERTIRVAAPTNEIKVLLTLVRVSFEGRPARGPIEAFRVAATPERARPIELDLFLPSGPAPELLDTTLARLAAVAGADCVGSPAMVSSHRPGLFLLERFAPPAPRPSSPTNGGRVPALALRAFRPPIPIEVVCDRGHPDFLRTEFVHGGHPIHGRVVTIAGPWRLHGEWWRAEPLARDDYDVEVSDGCVYRIYREHRSGRWYAAGVYD